jgi:hypothetical protein
VEEQMKDGDGQGTLNVPDVEEGNFTLVILNQSDFGFGFFFILVT